jgi:putative NADPH-quinone reductase
VAQSRGEEINCVSNGRSPLWSKNQNILVLDGHPDPANERFVHALATAYREGAEQGKHQVQTIRIADLEFPLLRSQVEYEKGQPVEAVLRCQNAIDWATHVVILYPLWLGSMPALLKALLEQMLRPGFAFSTAQLGQWPVKFLSYKSARVIVTMGMPALLYRWYFRAHSLRSLKRNVLRFVGFRSVRSTLIGGIAGLNGVERSAWLEKVRALGREGK